MQKRISDVRKKVLDIQKQFSHLKIPVQKIVKGRSNPAYRTFEHSVLIFSIEAHCVKHKNSAPYVFLLVFQRKIKNTH